MFFKIKLLYYPVSGRISGRIRISGTTGYPVLNIRYPDIRWIHYPAHPYNKPSPFFRTSFNLFGTESTAARSIYSGNLAQSFSSDRFKASTDDWAFVHVFLSKTDHTQKSIGLGYGLEGSFQNIFSCPVSSTIAHCYLSIVVSNIFSKDYMIKLNNT